VSDIIEDILGFTEEAIPNPAVVEPRATKQKAPVTEPKPETGILDEISKVMENLLTPVNRRLDDIEKRVSQPVQFKTSERATGSSSAAKPEAERPTGSAGQ
jgi:hypothetical protein